MSYKLTFLESSLKEWKKLPPEIRDQFKKKLIERLECPKVTSALLKGLQNCYKIKLRAVGYRLVYKVYDDRIIVQVIVVGTRNKNIVYDKARKRLL